MIPSCKNIYSGIPDLLPAELVEPIFNGNHLRFERIISRGHVTAPGYWYEQAWDEWVLLLQGQATLLFEQDMQSISLYPGDYLLIPSQIRHRVVWTHPEIDTIWLAVHFV